jgi:uncharacterized protein YndB with AHSA1/START domain
LTDFHTLTLERRIACTPERLFALMTDREARQAWSAPSPDTVIVIDHFDMRPGGREIARCGPRENPEFHTVTDFHVVEPSRIVATEVLDVGGTMLSVSLCTSDMAAEDGGSLLTVTLQIASLTGPELFDDYATGWGAALDSLARMAAGAVA